MDKITPCLWFDDEAEEAANFYMSLFKNSRIVSVSHYSDAGPRPAGMVMTVEFELDGRSFVALNGGARPELEFDYTVSFQIDCESQDEVDHYWYGLSEGGAELPCGWVTDKFGVSWQVVPRVLIELVTHADQGKAQRAMQAMLGMKRIDIEAIRTAAESG